MKTLTKIATLAIVLGTSSLIAASNDYAITEDYKLLNDMKLAKQQQSLIVKMSQTLESDNIDMDSLKDTQDKFSQVLMGLSHGNQSINLKGTQIPMIKSKLSEIQQLWKTELTTLATASSDSDNKEKAIDGLNTIMIKMSQAVALYNKSYSKFRQKSKLSSLVAHHMNNRQNKTFAFNTVR
jgi:hypothetical protein